MARLTNRAYTARAPQTAQQWPEMPDLDARISEIDGGRTNAALQRWSDLCAQRVGANEEQNNGRFVNIQRSITRGNDYLESVWTMQAIAGPVVTGMELFSSINRTTHTVVSRVTFQADVFQIQTASGNHKTVFSTSIDAIKLGDVVTVDLANARLYIGTGTYGNANTAFYVDDDGYFSLKDKLTFDPSGSGTLTITGTIVAGAGSIGGFNIGADYVRDAANSMGLASTVTGGDDVRFWAGDTFANRATAPFRVTEGGAVTATSGTIGGWTLSTTTLTASNVVINSAGTIALGTLNDILIVSAADATYRLWAGNATAGSASFSVTKTGALFSNSGTIGGFTIGATTLSTGTGVNYIAIANGTGPYIQVGADSTEHVYIFSSGINVADDTGTSRVILGADLLNNCGVLLLDDSVGSTTIELRANTGNIKGATFQGSGASLTNLDAGNISSGTLSNSRLPSAISVTSLTASGQIRGATARFGTHSAIGAETLSGYITITDDGGTSRKLGVIS